MTAPNDERICGWRLATGPLCHEPPTEDAVWCERHGQLQLRYCRGCGKDAVRECPSFVGEVRCLLPLCWSCEHESDGPGHGPARTPVDVARDELEVVVGLALREAVAIPEEVVPRVSKLVVARLSTHVTLKVLSGLAASPRESPTKN